MTAQGTELTFDQVPKALGWLINKFNEQSELVKEMHLKLNGQAQDEWLDIDEFCAYHPEKPRKPTVYTWASKGKVPHHSKGKKLYFLKSEIDAWLKEGRKKTVEEIKAEAAQYVKGKGVKNGR